MSAQFHVIITGVFRNESSNSNILIRSHYKYLVWLEHIATHCKHISITTNQMFAMSPNQSEVLSASWFNLFY